MRERALGSPVAWPSPASIDTLQRVRAGLFPLQGQLEVILTDIAPAQGRRKRGAVPQRSPLPAAGSEEAASEQSQPRSGALTLLAKPPVTDLRGNSQPGADFGGLRESECQKRGLLGSRRLLLSGEQE